MYRFALTLERFWGGRACARPILACERWNGIKACAETEKPKVDHKTRARRMRWS